MKKTFISLYLTIVVSCAFSQVLINEVIPKPGPSETSSQDQSMYMCSQTDYGREYVELYNAHPCDSADVSCYIIGGATGSINYGSYGIPQGTKIPPQGFLVIGGPLVQNVDLVITNACTSGFLCGANRWYLENTSGWVALYKPDGSVADAVFWTFGPTSNAGALAIHSNFTYTPCAPTSCFSGILKKPNEMTLNTEIFWGGWIDANIMLDRTFSRIPDGGQWQRDKAPTPRNCNDVCNPSGSDIVLDSLATVDIVCGGPATGSITVYVTGNPPFNYSLNGGSPVASPNNYYTFSNLNSGNYFISISDADSCGTLNIYDTLSNPGNINVGFDAAPLNGCAPLTVFFNDQTNAPGIIAWNWSFGDGSTSDQQNPVKTYVQSGFYNVDLTVTDNMNCHGTLTKQNYIEVYATPVADFYTVPPLGKTYDPTITFYSNTVADVWQWDFGDGGTSNSPPQVVHTYPATEQNYTVILIVENSNGCADTVQKTVSVIDDVLFFPNIITPNGDGHNDVLEITNAGKYTGNQLVVFNRWGNVVFKETDYKNTWDGANLSDGTYFYIFTYAGKEHTSTLTILR